MSLPPIDQEKTAAGIAVDPQTLERVVPESKRADGTIRKQIKIRPGFTPQEDVSRFRGSRRAQMDANASTKRHIPGWVPPSSASPKPLSKSAKKNSKRKAKKQKQGEARDNWEDEDEDEDDKEKDEAAEDDHEAAEDTVADSKQLETALEDLKLS